MPWRGMERSCYLCLFYHQNHCKFRRWQSRLCSVGAYGNPVMPGEPRILPTNFARTSIRHLRGPETVIQLPCTMPPPSGIFRIRTVAPLFYHTGGLLGRSQRLGGNQRVGPTLAIHMHGKPPQISIRPNPALLRLSGVLETFDLYICRASGKRWTRG